MNLQEPAAYYTDRITALEKTLQRYRKKGQTLAFLRGITFLAAILLCWQLWPSGWPLACSAAALALIAFLYAVSLDLSNKKETEHCSQLLQINRDETGYLQHLYPVPEDGKRYEETGHPYAADLDLFGQASLFRHINRCNNEAAQRMLSQWLLHPSQPDEVIRRQAAARELAAQTGWRQQLQAYSRIKPVSETTETHIRSWAGKPVRILDQLHWKIIRLLFPATGLSILGMYAFDIIPWPLFISIMLVMLGIAFYISKLLMPAWKELGRITAELSSFSSAIGHLEKASFRSPLLNALQEQIAVSDTRKASAQIRDLRRIMDKLDYRLNPIVFMPLSAFLCWDLLQVFELEKWKRKNATAIGNWLDALSQTEVLCSIGTVTFNHPEWCFPEFSSDAAFLEATAMGHPLIPENKRVCSSFSTSGKGTINLITGSNMAGKSTFLRSTGINIVLAMMGAPVCAAGMTLSPFSIMSSMRISDNLEESTSTFYAELKKLKAIIEAVERKEPVFLLLDEILRGTNSADRHTGSGALIRQLITGKAAGMVATHDLELAALSKEYPDQLRNYHFDVQIEGEELYFDYKLKEGVCTSMNASLLMKKIGIRI